MPARRAALSFVAVAAVVWPLAACSGDDEPAPTPTPSEADAAPLEAMLTEYLSDWSDEDLQQRLAEMEQLVASCMNEQGFEYTPVDYSGVELDLGAALELEPGSVEFAEQYGYGITTDPFTSGDAEVADPNEDRVAAMSDAERDAYLTALYGARYADAGATAEGETLEDYDWEQAGCTGRAQHEVMASGIQDEAFSALQADMVQMLADADADPRLAQVSTDWSACMLDAGFDGLEQVGDGEAAISAEVEAARADVYGGTPATADGDDPAAAARRALLGAADGGDPELDAAFDEALADITPREIDMAVADATCRADVGYDDVRRQVDTQYQLAFLAEHADEIQTWLETLSGDSGQD
ncbi:hypothetical protein [Actinotalea fermentans]|uniref:Uncharacterized protein n=1 Tax=Actinotalea fermentans TaxID=43671 RepID=A0A511YZT6_9CELL|nr:hypothetical protein [Actinotalea fermentans]KGM16645.1 hypothetical protein N867_17715 [Actinotalea fermentans ATCC 43279 = JCM 9966 = DSM 3133]GEN80683.1 hypothetical protein AFE02nite_24170 [Actinotalea fermentans]